MPLRRGLILLSLPLLVRAQSWIPYTADYRESATFKDVNGSENIKTKVFTETRSADGSVLRVEKSNGQVVSRTLWLGCGDMVSFDLAKKTANIGKHYARVHGTPPKEKPVGNAIIAGVTATAWPIHVQGGAGTAWIDTADDIYVKTELNTDSAQGHYSYVKEATKLDLDTPVNETEMKIPKNFAITGQTSACASQATSW